MMDLTKLFEMQRKLDDHILEEHPELKGQNNLDWKILALQVELGECANEWRGFKKWSNDREPRINVPFHTYETFKGKQIPSVGNRNPLLEEYVDCLHFILSIGNEIKCEANQAIKMVNSYKDWILENRDVKNTSITEQFNIVFNDISDFEQMRGSDDYYHMASEFFILGGKLGLNDKQVQQAYIRKNEVNHERQVNGY